MCTRRGSGDAASAGATRGSACRRQRPRDLGDAARVGLDSHAQRVDRQRDREVGDTGQHATGGVTERAGPEAKAVATSLEPLIRKEVEEVAQQGLASPQREPLDEASRAVAQDDTADGLDRGLL